MLLKESHRFNGRYDFLAIEQPINQCYTQEACNFTLQINCQVECKCRKMENMREESREHLYIYAVNTQFLGASGN